MKSSKPTLWLLVASVALNVFLVVAFAMSFLRPPPPPPQPGQIVAEMVDLLPPADAAILRQALETHGDALAQDTTSPELLRERMKQLVLTEPFDREAFIRLSSEFHANRDKMGKAVTEILADALPRMSPEGRKALADFKPPRRPR